jgi:hypothetical protein
MGGCANSFRVTHRVLMSCCSSFCRSFVDLSVCAGEVVPHRCGGEPRARCAPHTQGTSKGFPSHREVITLGRGMQVRSPAGCGGVGIGDDSWSAIGTRAGGHPQQLALGGSFPTSDAGPDRAREGCVGRARRDVRIACHRATTLPLRATSVETGAHELLFPGRLPSLGSCPATSSWSVSTAPGVPGDQAGLAAALLNSSQQVGGALGLAVLSAIATSYTKSCWRSGRRRPRLSSRASSADCWSAASSCSPVL